MIPKNHPHPYLIMDRDLGREDDHADPSGGWRTEGREPPGESPANEGGGSRNPTWEPLLLDRHNLSAKNFRPRYTKLSTSEPSTARVRLTVARKVMAPRRSADAGRSVYRFGVDGQYSVRIAASIEDRTRTWALVHEIYVEKGYALPHPSGLWYGIHDALPDTTTLLVEQDGRVMAALTLVFDSPLGLPADEIYRSELKTLRAPGRKLCEIVSLASGASNLLCGTEIMKNVFKLAYLVATRLHGATDFLITVNPRHLHFYQRTLLMEILGPERAYGKVRGAPAVLLGLDLEMAEDRYHQRYGEAEGSFYRFFVNHETESDILRTLMMGRRPLGRKALRRFFVEDRPLIPSLPAHLRYHIEACYPDYCLETSDDKASWAASG